MVRVGLVPTGVDCGGTGPPHLVQGALCGARGCSNMGQQYGAAIWGSSTVRWLCDNQAAVHAVSRRSCRDQDMMHLIRCLFFLEAWFGFEVEAVHLPGRENMLADNLSRNRLSALLSNAESCPNPFATAATGVAPRRQGLMMSSPRWTMLFYSIATAG